MAPALGYALVQPPVMALLIFVGLGLGLAFPFLLITYVPALANRLPKPGPWMESFKQFLAFPVYATAIWLVWVLAQQAGANGVALLLAAMLMVVLAVWCAGRSARLAKMVAILAIGLAAALVAFAGQQKGTVSASVGKQTWSKERVASLRAEGKPVFVNFTAAWCVTCIANEQVALSTTEVQQYFADHAIVYLEADWTQRDAPIAIELAAYGRSGVPLYLYFPVGGEAVILPQLLTPGLIIDRLEAAEGGV
jgi:thiol:disulfide interchange protein DsbD